MAFIDTGIRDLQKTAARKLSTRDKNKNYSVKSNRFFGFGLCRRGNRGFEKSASALASASASATASISNKLEISDQLHDAGAPLSSHLSLLRYDFMSLSSAY